MRIAVRQLVVGAILGALSIVLSMTPIGFIPVPTPAGAATTMHIPAILGGILEGPVVGAFVGLIFGLTSYLRAGTAAFADPLVAVVPRIFIGVVAYYAFRAASGPVVRSLVAAVIGLAAGDTAFRAAGFFAPLKHATATWPAGAVLGSAILVGLAVAVLSWYLLSGANGAPALGAIAGTLTNTVGVLGLMTWRGYLVPQAAFAVGVLHGLPEILAAVILTVAIYRAVERAFGAQRVAARRRA